MRTKKLVMTFFWMALAVGIAIPSTGLAVSPVFTNILGQAIRGYDPVAYFEEGKPVKGKSSYSYRWNDAKWYFSSEKNRDTFIRNPQQYAPQYGGYCAWAVSQGYTASIDPKVWRIHGGKLYLNYDNNVQDLWEKDIPGHIESADKNWPTILEK